MSNNYKCIECGYEYMLSDSIFCPNCGCKNEDIYNKINKYYLLVIYNKLDNKYKRHYLVKNNDVILDGSKYLTLNINSYMNTEKLISIKEINDEGITLDIDNNINTYKFNEEIEINSNYNSDTKYNLIFYKDISEYNKVSITEAIDICNDLMFNNVSNVNNKIKSTLFFKNVEINFNNDLKDNIFITSNDLSYEEVINLFNIKYDLINSGEEPYVEVNGGTLKYSVYSFNNLEITVRKSSNIDSISIELFKK